MHLVWGARGKRGFQSLSNRGLSLLKNLQKCRLAANLWLAGRMTYDIDVVTLILSSITTG
jgi:hypothetical protein